MWAFTLSSTTYGKEEYTGYSTKNSALRGIERIQDKTRSLDDGVERFYSMPYRAECQGCQRFKHCRAKEV